MSDWGPRDDKSRDLGIIMTESMTEICTTEYDISGLGSNTNNRSGPLA